MNVIIKKMAVATLYSAIVFCVLSYFSVMASLFRSVGKLSLKPVTNIGFPYKYYYQFWVRDSPSPNCGWRLQNVVIDAVLTWLFCTAIYLMITRKKTA